MSFCFTYWPGHFWVIGVLLQHKCYHRKLILCIDIGSIWCYWLADLRVWNALPVCWSSWCCQLFLPYHNVCGPWWCTVCKFLTCIHIHIHRLYSCFNSITFLVCLMLGKYLMGFLVYIKMTTLMQQMAWHHWTNRTFAVIRFNCAGAFTVMWICVGRSESYWWKHWNMICACFLFIVFFSEFCLYLIFNFDFYGYFFLSFFCSRFTLNGY